MITGAHFVDGYGKMRGAGSLEIWQTVFAVCSRSAGWLTLGIWCSGVLLTGAPPPSGSKPDEVIDADLKGVIDSLRENASDLTATAKRFRADLDSEIARHDRGYRTAAGRRISGADADLNGGPADLTET